MYTLITTLFQYVPVDSSTLLGGVALLAAGGAGVFVSWLVEKFDLFSKVSIKAKAWSVAALTLAVSVVAKLLIDVVPAETFALLEPFYAMIVAAAVPAIAIGMGQLSHNARKIKAQTSKE